jgi:hypothetical protein
MPKGFGVKVITLIAGLTFSPMLRAQAGKWNNSPPPKSEYAGKKQAAPAPRRDLSGIWNAAAEGGVQGRGPLEHVALSPSDTDARGGQADEKDIFHPLPYTPAGEAALKANKTATGVRGVAPELVNDPNDMCDPPGFPRMEFFEFRVIEINQAKNHVIVLNQYDNVWRTIWTDGRPLPDPNKVEARWYGYSVGSWVDDYTFVVRTTGLNQKTWLDNVGRPHSSDLTVEERFHRVDYDTLELTVTINDPKMYTQPWQGLNKFVLHRLPDDFDREEMICSASELADYNKFIGNPASVPQNKN